MGRDFLIRPHHCIGFIARENDMRTTVLCGLTLGLLAFATSAGRTAELPTEQEKTAAEITRAWGKVAVDKENPDKPLVEVYLSGSLLSDALLARLEGLARLRTLDLSYTQVTDTGLRHLQGLKQLRDLNLWVLWSRTPA